MNNQSTKHSNPRPLGRGRGEGLLLLLLLMLCCITTAWAGSGTGSRSDPYSGEWMSYDLQKVLKDGDYLAYDCAIRQGYIWVTDTKIKTQILSDDQRNEWSVSNPIDDTPWEQYQTSYCTYNTLEERQNHVFLVTKVKYKETWTYRAHIEIEGYYSGYYSLGDGSQENPYTCDWRASDLSKKIKDGDYLSYDCVIDGGEISVTDTQINTNILSDAASWTVGDPIDDTPWEPYTYYYLTNPQDQRTQQKFYVTKVETSEDNSSYLNFSGSYTGNYSSTLAPIISVSDYNSLQTAVKSNLSSDGKVSYAKIRLDADIYLSDGPEATLNNTFGGVLDGNGHTIWAARPETEHDGSGHYKRSYLFTYANGATFKNLKFVDIREESSDRSYQAVITSQATNNCVFENITLDHISIWGHIDEAGAVAGYAKDCTFSNIKVMNSDFTVGGNYVGAVVGNGDACTFTDIEVSNCEVTARTSVSGGVVGYARNCKFNGVALLGGHIKAYDAYAGGVAGISEDEAASWLDDNMASFANCTIDDKTYICADEDNLDKAYVGGIVGYTSGGSFTNCVNSAFVSGYGDNIGGIAGHVDKPYASGKFYDCLNTGMVISLKQSKVADFFSSYKNKEMICRNIHYKGKEYTVRALSLKQIEEIASGNSVGGIAGCLTTGKINGSTNLGSVYSTGENIAGIAGTMERSSAISCCLSEFTFKSNGNTRGIASGNTNECNVQNCLTLVNLNVTNHNSISGISNNNYTSKSGVDDNGEKSIDLAQLISGELCTMLGDNWQQNLDNDNNPVPGDKGLYYSRMLAGVDYATICVPYPLASVNAVGIKKREYYIFDNVRTETDGTISLCFKNSDEVPAGIPAIFRTDVNGTYVFERASDEYQFEPQTVNINDWTLNGTYRQMMFYGNNAKNIYYLDGTHKNVAIRNSDETAIKPFNAYLSGPDIDTLNGKSIRIVIDGEEDPTTALQLIGDDLVPVQKNGKTYTLMGTEAGKGYKGIVIKDGRKYVRK